MEILLIAMAVWIVLINWKLARIINILVQILVELRKTRG